MGDRTTVLIQAHMIHGRALPGRGPLQMRAGPQSFALKPGQLNLAGSVGRALPEGVRRKMEAFFKADFSNVRVYQGTAAQSIGAHAFTMGSQIHFAPGQYAPDTPRGQQLLGHELAHVLQQRQGRVRAPQGQGTTVVNDSALEAEADRMGTQAAAFVMPVQAKMASHKLVVGAYMHQGTAGLPPDLSGHAFVSLQGPNGARQTWGFSPEGYSRYDPGKDLGKLRAGVRGLVHRDDAAFGKPGVKLRSYELTDAQAHSAQAKINEYRSRHYAFSAQSRQCTTFASEVLRAASVRSGLSGQLRPADFYRKL